VVELQADPSTTTIDANALVRLVVGSFVEWALGVSKWTNAQEVLCLATWEYRREVRGQRVAVRTLHKSTRPGWGGCD
jgi:hypothetical protein